MTFIFTGFSGCSCDLTPKGCDHACCCDPDCDSETIAAWKLEENVCLDEIYDKAIVSTTDCSARATKAALSDLEGLRFFGKAAASLMCTLKQSEFSKEQNFVSTMVEADEIFDTDMTSTQPFTWNDPRLAKINTELQQQKGYQPEEFLLGNKVIKEESGDTKKIFLENDRIGFLSQGIFGHCSEHEYVKFM